LAHSQLSDTLPHPQGTQFITYLRRRIWNDVKTRLSQSLEGVGVGLFRVALIFGNKYFEIKH
jgi:hypothetical protein